MLNIIDRGVSVSPGIKYFPTASITFAFAETFILSFGLMCEIILFFTITICPGLIFDLLLQLLLHLLYMSG